MYIFSYHDPVKDEEWFSFFLSTYSWNKLLKNVFCTNRQQMPLPRLCIQKYRTFVILLQYNPPSLKLWYKKNLLRFHLIINNYAPSSQWTSFIHGVLHTKLVFCPFISFQLNGFELTISFYSAVIHSCPVTGEWNITSQSPFHVYKIEQCFCILKMIYRIIVTLGIKTLNLIQ